MAVKCDVCGKAGIGSFITLSVPDNAENAENEVIRHSLGPYQPGDYHVCWECLLSAVGIPKPGELPDLATMHTTSANSSSPTDRTAESSPLRLNRVPR